MRPFTSGRTSVVLGRSLDYHRGAKLSGTWNGLRSQPSSCATNSKRAKAGHAKRATASFLLAAQYHIEGNCLFLTICTCFLNKVRRLALHGAFDCWWQHVDVTASLPIGPAAPSSNKSQNIRWSSKRCRTPYLMLSLEPDVLNSRTPATHNS
mmetsp:Transcript_125377/g.400872  ORF Transcript_125377/g.400872 Transcript_125377/m.400872 type:complete len:152 (+) Transcript_125377:11-466(+)